MSTLSMCQEQSCGKEATFNYEGKTNGLRCSIHKLPIMINVINYEARKVEILQALDTNAELMKKVCSLTVQQLKAIFTHNPLIWDDIAGGSHLGKSDEDTIDFITMLYFMDALTKSRVVSEYGGEYNENLRYVFSFFATLRAKGCWFQFYHEVYQLPLNEFSNDIGTSAEFKEPTSPLELAIDLSKKFQQHKFNAGELWISLYQDQKTSLINWFMRLWTKRQLCLDPSSYKL